MNTETLDNCNDNARLSLKEVCRITGVKADAIYKRIRRGAFPPPDTRLPGIGQVYDRCRIERVYWTAKTLKNFLGTL